MTATLAPGRPTGAPPARPSEEHGTSRLVPTAEQLAVIQHRRGRLRVLAGPGTGKTTTIAASVAARIADGADPGSILVLTFARRAAAALASRIAGLVETTTVEPIVRTLHSYAYAVVRAGAETRGEPAPRMLGAGEADLVVRDLLAGHLEAGGGRWPEHLRPALAVPGFAAELREFLLRCAEREITPARLASLAARHARPEWRAVADFIREYREVSDLRQAGGRFGTALDQAELTVAALERLSHPDVLAAAQRRIRRIFIDEYQDVDPAQGRLIDLLAAGAYELVVVGDPDQAIYGFRGAVAGAMTAIEVDRTVALTGSRRLPTALVDASRRVAVRLPGPVGHRALVPAGPSGGAGELEVRVLRSPAVEAAFVADELRRANLLDGVPWARMAVLVRSPATTGPGLRRALAAAGVPVSSATEIPVGAAPIVVALLAALRAGIDPASMSADAAMEFLGSPVGGFDVIALRRLRRAIRTSCPSGVAGEHIAAVLGGTREVPPGLAPDLAGMLARAASLVAVARSCAAGPAEDALWGIWTRTGLERRLATLSGRGGREGQRADAQLDAVVALFDAAADLAVRLPGAGVAGLLDCVAGQQVPVATAGAGGSGGSATGVSLLSAHAAKGLEWDTVIVPGVQQECWPDVRRRADLLGLRDLFDAVDGVPTAGPAPDTDGLPAALAEERRLFYVAVTRASRRLVVTAVEDDDHVPSRFLAEIAGDGAVEHGWPRERTDRPRRPLQVAGLLADLRAAVTDPGRPSGERAAAAAGLARLATAGVRGAHPDHWQGLVAPSTDAAATPPGGPVTLSPSQVEAILACPLRAVLGRNGGSTAPSAPQLLGVLVHAIAHGVTQGVAEVDLDEAAAAVLDSQDHLPAWERARMARLITSMSTAVRTWVDTTSTRRGLIGSELPMDVTVPAEGDGDGDGFPVAREVRLTGRVDWLSRNADGRVVVTDFKTSAAVPSRAEVAAHPQLAVYQMATALGAFGPDERPGGAELVLVRSGSPKVMDQPALDPAGVEEWITTLRTAADAVAGASLIARQGAGCERCPVRSSCPLRSEGRRVTE